MNEEKALNPKTFYQVRRSECMRRARKFEKAIDEAAGAIGIYPKYAKAWLQVPYTLPKPSTQASLAGLDEGMPQQTSKPLLDLDRLARLEHVPANRKFRL